MLQVVRKLCVFLSTDVDCVQMCRVYKQRKFCGIQMAWFMMEHLLSFVVSYVCAVSLDGSETPKNQDR